MIARIAASLGDEPARLGRMGLRRLFGRFRACLVRDRQRQTETALGLVAVQNAAISICHTVAQSQSTKKLPRPRMLTLDEVLKGRRGKVDEKAFRARQRATWRVRLEKYLQHDETFIETYFASRKPFARRLFLSLALEYKPEDEGQRRKLALIRRICSEEAAA